MLFSCVMRNREKHMSCCICIIQCSTFLCGISQTLHFIAFIYSNEGAIMIIKDFEIKKCLYLNDIWMLR